MTNLEVALLVRELNPEQRLVLLLNDAVSRRCCAKRPASVWPSRCRPWQRRRSWRDCSAIASPVSFCCAKRLFAVLDLTIGENDPFVGHAVRAVAVDYRMLPVGHLREGATTGGRLSLGAPLAAGDRLIGILALPDLQRLLRRQPSSAAYAVEVGACPLPTRPWLAGLLRTQRPEINVEEAERAVGALPFRLAEGLTRGQAEDLLARLLRERVAGRVLLANGEQDSSSDHVDTTEGNSAR